MKFAIPSTVAGLMLAAGFSSPAVAQGSFTSFGVGVLPESVSNDGTVVAGTDSTSLLGGQVFRWTPASGLVSIQQFPSGSFVSGTTALSGDGSVIARNMNDSQGTQVAGRWSQFTGWVELGQLPFAMACPSLSSAYGTNDDGSVVVGLSWDRCSGRAFRWSQATGMMELSHLGDNARANCVSGDGMVIGGWDSDPNIGQRRASVWYADSRGQQILLPATPENPNGAGEVWATNSDGTVLVGWSVDTGGQRAFRYVEGRGVEFLGLGRATATNDDGSVVVGVSGDPFFGAEAAFVWTAEDGMMQLGTYLANQGIAVPAGTPLSYMTDISANGEVMVGRRGIMFDPTNPLEGFRVEMPAAVKYGQNAAPANTLDLSGSGSGSIGQTYTVTTSNLSLPTSWTIISTGSSAPLPFLDGALVVRLFGPMIVATGTPQGMTAATVNLSIPNNPALVGASLYMQSLAPETSLPSGWAFSNGLKFSIRK